jgi:hypothetical protein
VINVSATDLIAALDRLGGDYGAPPLDPATIDGLRAFEAKRRAAPSAVPGDDASALAFDMEAAQGLRPWPESRQLLSEAARSRIAALYAEDFAFFAAHLSASPPRAAG